MEIQENEIPFVSIIVVTLNRRKHLEDCLNSLLNLEYPASKFEVIVVDGDSTDGTKEMVYTDFSGVSLIIEKRKGIVYARNTGWKHAKGIFVAYTDDDCVVDPYWLKSLVSGFTSTEIGAVGGPVLYLHPELLPLTFHETPVGPFSLGEIERAVEANENIITANLMIRSEILKKIRFLESLVYNDSEDVEFSRSLTEAGYKILYMPKAKVYHNIDPKRVNLSYLIKRAFFSGISFYIIERKRGSKAALIPKFLRFFVGGSLHFFLARRVRDFYWFVKCFIAFLTSVLLILF